MATTLPTHQSFLQKAKGFSELCLKLSSKGPSPENFLATGGCFKCNTYYVMALGWLKEERQKKDPDV